MSAFRCWLAVSACSIAIVLLGFGCATKSSEKSKPNTPAKTETEATTKPAQPTPPTVAASPVYVPDLSHISDPLTDKVFTWNSVSQVTNVPAGEDQAHFTFDFTNVSPDKVTIVNVHPSCGCTTAQLPPLPWTVPSGTNAQFGVTVNIEGKTGTLFKTVNVATDKGSRTLMLRITIKPAVMPKMTAAERARGVAIAKIDRQAVFKNDCATCHAKPAEGKYGEALYNAVCAICHEGKDRATMVPDLHTLKVPTNEQFWQIWIAHGKPGTFMPAFSQGDGGPLTEMQIASLAAYLNSAIPSHVPPMQQ
jgi:mono/diheme cytochrome c family protein